MTLRFLFHLLLCHKLARPGMFLRICLKPVDALSGPLIASFSSGRSVRAEASAGCVPECGRQPCWSVCRCLCLCDIGLSVCHAARVRCLSPTLRYQWHPLDLFPIG